MQHLTARNGLVACLVVLAGLTGAACSGFNDDRGIGDAPVDQQPDQARKVWPNGDQFPNVSAFCIGDNGVYTTTRANSDPVVVVGDPECGENGALLPQDD